MGIKFYRGQLVSRSIILKDAMKDNQGTLRGAALGKLIGEATNDDNVIEKAVIICRDIRDRLFGRVCGTVDVTGGLEDLNFPRDPRGRWLLSDPVPVGVLDMHDYYTTLGEEVPQGMDDQVVALTRAYLANIDFDIDQPTNQ